MELLKACYITLNIFFLQLQNRQWYKVKSLAYKNLPFLKQYIVYLLKNQPMEILIALAKQKKPLYLYIYIKSIVGTQR